MVTNRPFTVVIEFYSGPIGEHILTAVVSFVRCVCLCVCRRVCELVYVQRLCTRGLFVCVSMQIVLKVTGKLVSVQFCSV